MNGFTDASLQHYRLMSYCDTVEEYLQLAPLLAEPRSMTKEQRKMVTKNVAASDDLYWKYYHYICDGLATA